MKVPQIIQELEAKYPDKTIVKNDANDPTEIICEVEPTRDHPEYSLAIAVIDRSVSHYHKISTEAYTVIKGKLTLMINDEKRILHDGEQVTIPPGATHSAQGDEVWVQVESRPGWTFEDHIIAE
ncbi:cupin domain-containing protein [Candidatus Woesebacteria bacterium]|nr:cupin domain-containing protein [Candidatus Woesebacteria bacterium]